MSVKGLFQMERQTLIQETSFITYLVSTLCNALNVQNDLFTHERKQKCFSLAKPNQKMNSPQLLI